MSSKDWVKLGNTLVVAGFLTMFFPPLGITLLGFGYAILLANGSTQNR